jgi:hypothetical protein
MTDVRAIQQSKYAEASEYTQMLTFKWTSTMTQNVPIPTTEITKRCLLLVSETRLTARQTSGLSSANYDPANRRHSEGDSRLYL